jgi:hypothetical protein
LTRLTAVLATSLAMAAAPSRAQGAAPRADYTPVEFTISGGISLGNYEAGLNWAVVRFIKMHQDDAALLAPQPPPRMVVATGASAGNINALVAAIEWCRQDKTGPTDNLFFQSWMPVGVEGLFAGDRRCVQYCEQRGLESTWAARVGGGGPDACLKACQKDCVEFGGTQAQCQDGGPGYRTDDGIFTRRAFLAVEENFRAALEKGRFDEACKLGVGVTTTRFTPALLDLLNPRLPDVLGSAPPPRYFPQPYRRSPGGLSIDTQRFVTALRAETRGGRFGFYEHAFSDDQSLGLYLHLPVAKGADNLVAVEDVLALTEASSAFPLAFGPRKLRFCRVMGEAGPATELCVQNEKLVEDWFVDGGAFDNIPLGLGFSLTQRMLEQLREEPKGIAAEDKHFFYIDPERRRYLATAPSAPGEAGTEAPQPVAPGLANVVKLGTNFFSVAASYELQAVARYGQTEYGWSRPPNLIIADRLMPITGKYLFAFGAFLAEPFRRFDFAVGAYDGAYSAAKWVCDQRLAASAAVTTGARARCILQTLQTAYGDLGLTGQDAAETRYVFHELLEREFDTWSKLAAEADRAELAAVAAEAASWSKSQGHRADAPPDTAAAVGALMRVMEGLHDEEIKGALGDKDAAEAALKHENDLAYFLQQVGTDALASFSGEEQELLADPEVFTNRALLAMVSRERQIEHANRNGATTRVLAGAQLVLISQLASKTLGWEWDPSSIPDDNLWTVGKVLSRALPYRLMFGRAALSADGAQLFPGSWERLEASYEPGWGLAPRWAVLFPAGATWSWGQGTLGLFGGPGVMLRTQNLWLSGVDASLRATQDLVVPASGTASFRLGAELGLRGLGGKVRLAVVMEDFGAPLALGFRLGIVDFNGILYWTGRIITGQ